MTICFYFTDIPEFYFRIAETQVKAVLRQLVRKCKVWTFLGLVFSPHRRFGKQTLRCPRALLNSSLAPDYGAWLAQLPQCPDAPHTSHASPEGPDYDAALLPSGEGKSTCGCQGKMAVSEGEIRLILVEMCLFSGPDTWFKVLGDKETTRTKHLWTKHVISGTFQTPRKRKTRHSSNPPMECHVGWVMDSREHRSRTASVRWDSHQISFSVCCFSFDNSSDISTIALICSFFSTDESDFIHSN